MPILEKKEGILAMLTTLRGDVERDVIEFSGRPFNGATVGAAYGNLAAQVDALANAMIEIVKTFDGLEECLHEGVYAANGASTMYCPHCECHVPVEEL